MVSLFRLSRLSQLLATPLSLPPRVLRSDASARAWLRRNTRLLHILSDASRALALLTPSAHAELRAEGAATAVALLSLYRDLPPPRTHRSLPVLLLSLLEAVQLLLEMLALRRDRRRLPGTVPASASSPGGRSHLRFLTMLELAKFVLRLSLLAASPRHLTPSDQALPERLPLPECVCGMRDVSGADRVRVENGRRSGRKILSVAGEPKSASKRAKPRTDVVDTDGEKTDPLFDALFIVAYERRSNWIIRMLVPEAANCPGCAAARAERTAPPASEEGLPGVARAYSALQPAELSAEIAYLARPLVHVLLIRRFGWRSWRAWIAALVLDLASRLLMATPKDAGDVEERRRRMALIVLYLGRSPLFDVLMRGVVKRIVAPLRAIPLVGGATSSAVEWATLLQQYWVYTSGS